MSRCPRNLRERVIRVGTDQGFIQLKAEKFWEMVDPRGFKYGEGWRAREFREELRTWAETTDEAEYRLSKADLIILQQVIRRPLDRITAYWCKSEADGGGGWGKKVNIESHNRRRYWRYSCPEGHTILEIGVENKIGNLEGNKI